MRNDAIINCEKCNSINIELLYKYPNHIHAIPISWTSCADCGHPSVAMGFLSYSGALNMYIEDYSKRHPINCDLNDFRNRVVECVKRQIVQSCLFDEKDNILDRKDGYYNFNSIA